MFTFLIAVYILRACFPWYSYLHLDSWHFWKKKKKDLEKIKSIADHREEDSQGGKVGNNSVRDSWRKRIPTFTGVGEKGK